MSRSHAAARRAAAILALSSFVSSAAHATEGYFQHGYGARHKALGGAGVADGRDSTTTALNPAGLVHADDEATFSVSAFSPRREFEGGLAPGFTPTGTVESDSNWFAIPNLAASYRLAPNPFADVIGFSVYGSGGMNTNYPSVPGGAFSPGPGVFGFGRLGGRSPAGADLGQRSEDARTRPLDRHRADRRAPADRAQGPRCLRTGLDRPCRRHQQRPRRVVGRGH